jgi:phosphoglycolate phosphatase-like HAD superfamily hydrolase
MHNSLQLWNDTPTRQAILDFVSAVTTPGHPDYVAPEARIATFDNDGTLWCEKPMYIQFDYLLCELTRVAEHNAELRAKQPWKAAWEKDYNWLGESVTKHYQGDDGDFRVLLDGILSLAQDKPVEQVESGAKTFVETERHPELGMRYQDCAYRPMVELLGYLAENGFINYIVSGGGRDFMRGFAQDLYGIPRERVIGSTVAYRYTEDEDGVRIVQRPELAIIDDGPGKPVQIWNVIGRRPILAAGNATGDIEMLKFAESSGGRFLNLLLLHDDDQREYAYRRGAEAALALATERDWQIISMKSDFQQVF